MRQLFVRALALAILLTVPSIAKAGPPLICHPFDIGTARSLPIGPADGGGSAIDAAYDRSRLVADTLALLTPSTPTLVRMETLRSRDDVRGRRRCRGGPSAAGPPGAYIEGAGHPRRGHHCEPEGYWLRATGYGLRATVYR